MHAGTVGFIGLGIMGTPMAKNLLRAGFEVVVWARSPQPVEELVAAGARSAADVEGVFAAADTVILMLRDETAVDAVLRRATAAFAPLVAQHTIVQMGTFTTAFSQQLAEDVRAAGGDYVEAPVSGSRGPATEGTLVAMLAGEEAALERAAPYIAAMSSRQYRCGAVPSALTMKLAVNTFLITMVTGLAEAFHFAQSSGADITVLADVIADGPMASVVSTGKATKLLAGDLSPQATISDVLKNARLVEDAARTAGSAHPLIEASRRLYESAEASGHGAEDMIGVIAAFLRNTEQQR